MRLPEEFVARMAGLLQEEWPQLLEAWEGPPQQGLRINTLKISVEDFLSQVSFQLEAIPWTKDGFYYKYGERPAKHPYYQAGQIGRAHV